MISKFKTELHNRLDVYILISTIGDLGIQNMPPSAAEQIRKLDDQRKKLIEGAKAEAMQNVQKAIDDLNALGFSYRLVEATVTGSKGAARKSSDGPCPICKFKTVPPHDGRRHRSQGDNKRPFSAQELSDLGLARL
jgi:hypothetical protein